MGEEATSSSPKKGAGTSSDDGTNATSIPVSKNINDETTDALSDHVGEEGDGNSNNIESVSAQPLENDRVVIEESSGLDDAAVETVEPAVDKNISAGDEDGTNKENAVVEEALDDPTACIKENICVHAEVDAEAKIDEAIVNPMTESNDGVVGDGAESDDGVGGVA